MADETNVQPVSDEQSKEITNEILNSWHVKVLERVIPGGDIVGDVIATVVEYVEAVEKAVAIKGAGEAKKSIVEETTVKFLLKKFPEIKPFQFIVEWGVDHLIDWIVDIKNKHGWSWIPITNG